MLKCAAVLALALRLERPGALGLAGLALLLLLLARRSRRARPQPTGLLELWERARLEEQPETRARRVPPLPAVLAALAIVLGSLALAVPSRGSAQAPRAFTLVCDRSPSTALPLPGGGSRLEAALEGALATLREAPDARSRVRWRTQGRPELDLALGERPSEEWFRRPAAPLPEVDWAREDRPGALWVTDRVPDVSPEFALVFASGGQAVPGPVSADARSLLRWDGRTLVTEERPPDDVWLYGVDAARLGPLARFLEVWARERGLRWHARRELPSGAADGAALRIRCVDDGGPPVELRLDSGLRGAGWSVHGVGRGALPPDPEGGRPFAHGLEGAREVALVRARPGHVTLALTDVTQIEGNPALFAVDWARLLDGALLPPQGVVPLAERGAAGARRFDRLGDRDAKGAPETGKTTPPTRLAIACAGLAAACALAAWVASLRPLSPAGRRRRGVRTGTRPA